MEEDIALADPFQPVLGERRVVGNRIIEIEPTEPPVCEVEPYLLAQLPLRADAEAVADDKHPDQQLGIDRRPADVAVEWTQLFVQVTKHRCHKNIDPAQQMALWDHVIEPEFVEQARLLSMLLPHHRRIFLPSFTQQESSFSPSCKPFFDSIDPKRTLSKLFYWRPTSCSSRGVDRRLLSFSAESRTSILSRNWLCSSAGSAPH